MRTFTRNKFRLEFDSSQYANLLYDGELIGNIHSTDTMGWCAEYYDGETFQKTFSEYFADCVAFLAERTRASADKIASFVQEVYEKFPY